MGNDADVTKEGPVGGIRGGHVCEEGNDACTADVAITCMSS